MRPTIRLIRPTAGQAFQFGQSVPFEVQVTDPDGPVDCSRVSVIYSLGHNEHAHPQTTAAGCTGVIATVADAGHSGQANLRGVFQAEYRGREVHGEPALMAFAELVLTPGG
jgi:hypothetical protein